MIVIGRAALNIHAHTHTAFKFRSRFTGIFLLASHTVQHYKWFYSKQYTSTKQASKQANYFIVAGSTPMWNRFCFDGLHCIHEHIATFHCVFIASTFYEHHKNFDTFIDLKTLRKLTSERATKKERQREREQLEYGFCSFFRSHWKYTRRNLKENKNRQLFLV